MDRTVTVVGSATVSVDPDCARLSCGVQVMGADAQDALRRTNETMRAITDALSSSGIDRADVRTVGPHLFPTERGYSGSNDVSVLVRDVDTVGQVIDAVAAAAGPALTVHGVGFSVLDPLAHLSGLRTAAMASARTIAEELAQASGASVGEVVTISEGTGGPPMVAGLRAATFASATPVEAGSETLRFDVTVTYRLIDAD